MGKTKIPHAEARVVAKEIHAALKDHCEVFTFAGSLRRLSPMVGDIEAVVIPRMEEVPDGLFGTKFVRCRGFVMAVHSLGHWQLGDPNDGRYCRIVVGGTLAKDGIEIVGGTQLDLFIPQESDYGRQLAIRTGPSDYSSKVLAVRWNKLGWCGTKDGLRRQSQCTDHGKDGKHDWRLNKGLRTIDMPPVFDTEESFFKFLEIEYVQPKDRR